MTETIIAALIASIIPLLGTIVTNVVSHGKTVYRIEQLEKKQDKHNCLIERMYEVEKELELLDEKVKVANHRIEDLEK